ncbi:MAG: SpoIIE family protein phosphatase [bacterium]|nr:SpoIIE family protein phosphatase [bacterium]
MGIIKKINSTYLSLNLRNKFLIPTIIVLFISFLVFTILLIRDQRAKSIEQLEGKAENITFLLKHSNVDSVWNFNGPALEANCKSFFKDKEIVQIIIKDSAEADLINLKKNTEDVKGSIIKKAKFEQGGEPIGSLQVAFTSYYIEKNLNSIMYKLIIMSLIIFGLIILLISYLSNVALLPLKGLMAGVRHLTEGDLKFKIKIFSKDELGRLGESFNTMSEQLRQHQENLEALVTERTKQLEEAMDALWGEMELAQKIQTALLPLDPQLEGYKIAASLMPADEVGGDYYDVINIGEYNWVIIGDVSGHGITAGLIMMMAQTSIHTVLIQNPSMEASLLIETINETMTANIKLLGESKYMTLTVLAAFKDGEFIFAGLHQDILVYRSASDTVESIETSGMWIGIEQDINGLLPVDSLTLDYGDIMVLYTDGVTEALDENEEMFSDEKLVQLLKENGTKTPFEIHWAIKDELEPYKKPDDVTIVIIKRDPK